MITSFTFLGKRITLSVFTAPFHYKGWTCTRLSNGGWEAKKDYTILRTPVSYKRAIRKRIDDDAVLMEQIRNAPPQPSYRMSSRFPFKENAFKENA